MSQIVTVTMQFKITDAEALKVASAAACKDMNLGEEETGPPCVENWVHWCVASCANTMPIPGTDLIEHDARLEVEP